MTRLARLVASTLQPPPGRQRIILALVYGVFCHAVFALAVLAMVVSMFFGMSESFGRVSAPWAIFANAALLVQFPVMHSLLLGRSGRGILKKLAPSRYAGTLSTTTYAIVASIQLLALFALWTPSGVVWWRAEGTSLALMTVLYASAWLLLIKASYDAGAEVQSGALGWMSLVQNRKPTFPDMPTVGLFRVIRQPIYVAFALTLWTVSVWTPDQLVVAVTLTAYCLLAPLLKERRFEARFGARFHEYKQRVPYALPRIRRSKTNG